MKLTSDQIRNTQDKIVKYYNLTFKYTSELLKTSGANNKATETILGLLDDYCENMMAYITKLLEGGDR